MISTVADYFSLTKPSIMLPALFLTGGAAGAKQEYRAVNLPILPAVKGDLSALSQINVYHWVLVLASLPLIFSGKMGWIFLSTVVIFGIVFLSKSYLAKKLKIEINYRRLFGYSSSYLFLLSGAIIIDGLF
jgi:protoheme IX farnesyltransferase